MLVAIAAGALSATPPTFAQDFYVGLQDSLAINQGGYGIANGVCCSLQNAGQCKVQGINMGSDTYEQGSQERTRSDSAQGSIVNWWGNVKKQMALVPGSAVNSTHKYACAQYCPVDGEFEPSLVVGDGQKGPFDTPKDKGQVTITQPKAIGGASKVCEHWKWTETLLKIIPMSTTDFYVDNSATPPNPFFKSQVIKPFNKPIGQENASYIGYKPMDVSDFFDIDPDSVTSCKMSDKCNPPPSPPSGEATLDELTLEALSPRLAAFRALLPKPTLYEQAEREAHRRQLSGERVAADPPPQPNVSFVADFTAHENAISLIAQGASKVGGDPCCMSNGGAMQCQVQMSHRAGMRYLDVTNQRTRFDDVVGKQVIVDDYTSKKSMLINVTGGVETCQEYCPIDPQDKLEPIDPFDPFDPVVDMGKTTFEGQPAEHYQWKEKILKVITMQTTDFYANIDDPKNAIPIASISELTPFGQKPPIGTTNQTWSAFKAGTPDAGKFKIAGMDSCPMSNKCQSNTMNLHRHQMKQLHTLARYLRDE